MRRGRRIAGIGAAVALGLAIALRLCFSSLPLPPPPPLTISLPRATPPRTMTVRHLRTGVLPRSAAFAYGGSPLDHRDFPMSALLVRHPGGDLLIDGGLARDVDRHLAAMPAPFRAITTITRRRPAVDQLAAAGYDPKNLRGLVLTHAHWDHASGVADFPGVPVWVNAAERRFIDEGGDLTAVLRGTPGVRYQVYDFPGGPYLGYPQSYDVYGDGAIVVVPAPGHTPGSIVVFLALPDGQRLALLGDLCWQREGVTERRQRPWLLRQLGDHDVALARRQLLHMAALAAALPQLTLVPAHDGRGYQGLPDL